MYHNEYLEVRKIDFGCYYSHPTIKYESFDAGSRKLFPCELLNTAIQILELD